VINWIWIILVLIIVVNVTMRYALRVNYIWVEEVQWHMYAVGFMLGIGYAILHDAMSGSTCWRRTSGRDPRLDRDADDPAADLADGLSDHRLRIPSSRPPTPAASGPRPRAGWPTAGRSRR
jgi:hypothetical protein